MSLKNVAKEFYDIQFRGCQLGNSAANKLSCLCYQSIQIFRISSDSLGNKGIKNLTQLHLPSLAAITINNTNITTDIIKVMKKRTTNGFLAIQITKQKKIQYDQLLK